MDKEEEKLAGVLDNWNLLRKIGCGGTSSVYLGYDKGDEEMRLHAIKVLNPKKNDPKYFKAEIEMLKKLDHPNIVKIVAGGEGVFEKSDGRSKYVNYIVLELIKNGELFDFIFFAGKGFGEEFGRLIFLEILSGLQACHKAGVVHRDLKTENVMVGEDFSLKIADFGFAALKQGKEGNGLLYTTLGTPAYAAPELHDSSPYFGICNDIFALAVTLFVIVTGTIPFHKATKNDPFYPYVIKNDYEGYWYKRGVKMNLSDEFKSLIFNMIAYDYTQRPTIDEIKQHPWVLQINHRDLLSLKASLKEDFANRKKIVEFKRMKERTQKIEEKLNKKVNISKVYRSGDALCFAAVPVIDRQLEDFIDYGNLYVLVFDKASDPKTLYKNLNDFFKNKKAAIKESETLYSMKVNIPIQEKESEEFENEFVTLKINVSIKNFEQGKLIVEFTKRSGDRLAFYKIYEELEKNL